MLYARNPAIRMETNRAVQTAGGDSLPFPGVGAAVSIDRVGEPGLQARFSKYHSPFAI